LICLFVMRNYKFSQKKAHELLLIKFADKVYLSFGLFIIRGGANSLRM